MGTRITDATSGATIEIFPTSEWALIPVTSADGRHGVIRRQLYAARDGRLFVLVGKGFEGVERAPLGGYRLTGIRFLEGEWHFGEDGTLVPGPEPRKEPPAWVIPGVPSPSSLSPSAYDGWDFC